MPETRARGRLGHRPVVWIAGWGALVLLPTAMVTGESVTDVCPSPKPWGALPMSFTGGSAAKETSLTAWAEPDQTGWS